MLSTDIYFHSFHAYLRYFLCALKRQDAAKKIGSLVIGSGIREPHIILSPSAILYNILVMYLPFLLAEEETHWDARFSAPLFYHPPLQNKKSIAMVLFPPLPCVCCLQTKKHIQQNCLCHAFAQMLYAFMLRRKKYALF